jgi:hypothetical protein
MGEEIKAGGLTQQEIDNLKKKHGKIYLISVIDPNTQQPSHFWFKKPNMKIMSAATSHANNPFKMGGIMFDQCLIKGDKTAKDDVDVYPAIIEKLAETIKTAKATLEEF